MLLKSPNPWGQGSGYTWILGQDWAFKKRTVLQITKNWFYQVRFSHTSECKRLLINCDDADIYCPIKSHRQCIKIRLKWITSSQKERNPIKDWASFRVRKNCLRTELVDSCAHFTLFVGTQIIKMIILTSSQNTGTTVSRTSLIS